MNNSRIFYTFFLGFVLAISICSFFQLSPHVAIFSLIFSGLVFVFRNFLAGSRSMIIILAIFLFSFALGILRYDLKDSNKEKVSGTLATLVGQKVNVTGIIVDEPNIKEENARLTVKVNSTKILVSTSLFPKFKYGDLIKVQGKLEQPENFTSTSGNDFDYVGFLAKDDIFYEISFAHTELVSSGHGSYTKEKLFAFKNAFMSRINYLIKEPESSLLGGLLLGAKNSLGKEWQDNFRKAGVSHIVALSGYNITIVAEGIMLALSFLPRMLSLSAGALGIFLFAIMTGGSATVLRASIMALLVLLAKATGRIYDVVRALFVAAMFMLIQNPKILVFDISFQLSFLSTIALIFVSPIIEKKFLFITEKYPSIKLGTGKLREMVLATVATQIFVLPFIFYKMGMISLVSLPVNLLILPLIPIIMFLGFLTGMIALVSNTLALPFAWLSSLLLSYELTVIKFFADIPFSALNLKNFPLFLVALIYIIFIFFIVRFQIVSRPPPS
jgi:competence protein ComEC